MKSINFITSQEVIQIHELLIKTYNGIPGIRDKRLLESAIAQPSMTIFGVYLYKNLYEMAASYCYHIIKNHAFVDGNKRTGILTTLVFLEKNGLQIKPKANLYDLALDIAASQITKEQVAEFFRKNAKKKQ